MSACREVTIKKIIPLFKDDVEANSIELIELEEVGNTMVSAKDTYQVGDKAVFIEPDFCLSDIPLFDSFIRPNGESSKSRLGKRNRIKAIKFNLHTGNGMPTYSYGILLPVKEVMKELNINDYQYRELIVKDLLTDRLGITKYENETDEDNSPNASMGSVNLPFPKGFYKTDETNINNLWNRINYPITLIGTEKVDGSSITIYSIINEKNERVSGICSRNLEQPITYKKVVGRKEYKGFDKVFMWIKKKCVGLTKEDQFIYETVVNESAFVRIGLPYLQKLVAMLEFSGKSIILKGELNGVGLKGSGNKNNPHAKLDPNISFFAMDKFDGILAIRQPEEDFKELLTELEFERCPILFTRKMRCKADVVNLCEQIFAKEKEKGRILEGIVLKSEDGVFSAKYMNMEYDSKK